ncbi:MULTISPECIES: chromophore lyase CpcT/CpeT [Nostocales]|uniref:Chromophore lyase CpcT/CpeT n=3 Tax=Nostocales TaxID=1161 RepID=A0A0C1NE57_9CYAN|nr:chromophore lyase CpcT/CpeT [Tolypothrix bouteillei]KAF3887101.1 chorismate mutase [Tolypothrix bouteillei VB521301]
MTVSQPLLTLARYLLGEFDNREQALADPAWYVHLRLWHRKVPLFQEDSVTIFAEQANIVQLDKPYRQRILRLTEGQNTHAPLKAQYYMPKNPTALLGAGRNPDLLNRLTYDQLELLPSCVLDVKQDTLAPNSYKFTATPPANTLCSFTYGGSTIQISLGFESTEDRFMSFDKGIDPSSGKATWGAILGPYRYNKREQF